MRVTHLYHSGFLIELEECTLLFDWYPTTQERLMEDLALIPRTGRLYVFVSHNHHDHFLPSIWKMAAYLPKAEVTFIVDSVVAGYAPTDRELDIVACDPEQIYEIDEHMEVTTLNSTDEGVAFCVDIDRRTIYHAGDLSVWWWPERDVSLNKASEEMCRYFLEIIASDPHPGKKLGFILQEMGREINTTGSKANHAGIQKLVVRAKDELEKIREQSMNIL